MSGVVIDMINNLTRQKVAAKHNLQHQAMLREVCSISHIGMQRREHQNVSVLV